MPSRIGQCRANAVSTRRLGGVWFRSKAKFELARDQLLHLSTRSSRHGPKNDIHPHVHRDTALAALPSSLPLRPTGVITGAHVRYCYEGGTFRRDGRLLPLDDECTSGAQVLAALEADGADLSRFSARAYDDELSGWAPLTADTIFDDADGSSRRVDVQLFRKTPPPARSDFDGEQAAAAGYFNIGVVGAKHSHNLGSCGALLISLARRASLWCRS